jgi:hypothetical protein
MKPCAHDGCENEAAPHRRGLCRGHYAQVAERHLSMTINLMPRKQSPMERLARAAVAYADAETDEDFVRAKERLRAAAIAYQRNPQRSGSST